MTRTVMVISLLALAACQSAISKAEPMMANPASQNCLAYSGKLVIRQSASGQKGYCVLPNGKAYDEWEFYHQTHP